MENNQPEIENDEQPDSPSPDQPEKVSNFVWPFLVCIAIIVVIANIFNIADAPRNHKRQLETLAKGRLREFGKAELAYQHLTDHHYYGSFSCLQKQGLIEPSYNQVNIVDGFSIGWDGKFGYTEEEIRLRWNSEDWGDLFTIVAYPNNRNSLKLCTFGITDDQILRVYNPDHGNTFTSRDDPHVLTWDPVL